MVEKRKGLSPIIRIIGHRGSADPRIQAFEGIDENTIKAFDWALKNGAAGIECDIGGMTTDGHLVMNHDTAVGGRSISEMNLVEVGKILPNVSTFADVAYWLSRSKAECLLEIKSLGYSCYPAKLVIETLATIELYHIKDRIQIVSFNPEILRMFWDHGWTRLGFLYKKMQAGDALIAAVNTHSSMILPEQSLVNTATVKLFRDYGLKIGVWTVDDPKKFEQLMKLRVDYVITNRADKLVPLLPEN